jgi:hypothetical protein
MIRASAAKIRISGASATISAPSADARDARSSSSGGCKLVPQLQSELVPVSGCAQRGGEHWGRHCHRPRRVTGRTAVERHPKQSPSETIRVTCPHQSSNGGESPRLQAHADCRSRRVDCSPTATARSARASNGHEAATIGASEQAAFREGTHSRGVRWGSHFQPALRRQLRIASTGPRRMTERHARRRRSRLVAPSR